MDEETVIKSLEKDVRIAEAAGCKWLWIKVEQARKLLEILREGTDELHGKD